MECPICHFYDLAENANSCPQCKSDLELLNFIDASKKVVERKNRIVLIISVLLIGALLLNVYVIIRAKKAVGFRDNIITELKNANFELDHQTKMLYPDIEDVTNDSAVTSYYASKQTSEPEDTDTQLHTYTEHIVESGENLWIIAQKYYNDGYKFKKIAKDNNIKNPSEIIKGAKLKIYSDN